MKNTIKRWVFWGVSASHFLLNLTSCTPVAIENPETNGLEATIPFIIEGKQYVGTATVQRKSNQKFEIDFGQTTVWGLFATCHRDIKMKNPKGKVIWYYIPAMYIENLKSCIMIHKQINNKGNSHYAIINFTAGEALLADMYCNGSKTAELGSSICQARAGSEQMLWFKEPVKAFTDDACNQFTTSGDYQYYYKTTQNFCAYVFRNKAGEIHRHVTYGYQKLDLED